MQLHRSLFGPARSVAPAIMLAMIAVTGPCSSGPAHPMGDQPTGAYEIEVSVDRDEFVPITIGAEGEGCERFSADEDAERTCLIARLLNPLTIGGEAYGDLNERHTPALDALIWRARSNADPTICERGGLEGELLGECNRAAQASDYEYVSGNVRVRVPIGGASPVSSPGSLRLK
jgi:hypothetical protein